ncbi:CDP-diacylglycerol-serine O-phosphatidyltransferase [Starmerella bacillaris]|uniref:CDP-diacylglycerol--serine O-phosphatidyltransferase n=1 Tax=Starmerella bacillaris TaxID=1247836 RepID=A0AAV5RHU2_STABA|nr:CDP-diacylglycerol-serine O-phosphatidyltransferase [Starmerella bacillaris]
MERGRPQIPMRRRKSIFSPSPSPPPPEEREQREYLEDKRHLSMVRQLQLADWITMLNCYCGFNSIISSTRYISSDYERTVYIYRAVGFAFAGFFFDVFDGRVARWMNKSSLMGKELDSLADLVSFGVAPAAIGFSIGMQTTLDLLILSFFVLCGLLRLARYNVTAAILSKGQSKVAYFEGLPIPTSLVLVGIMLIFELNGLQLDNLPGGIIFAGTPFEFHPSVLMFFALGCAYVSKSLKIPKL